MDIIGPHIINGAGPHLDVLRRWQPRLALVLDPAADDLRAFKAACPRTIIVGRIYRPDDEVNERIRANPAAAARWAHEIATANSAVRSNLCDYVQVANEVCQQWDGLPLLNDFELERMRLADAAGYKCALFGFSVGNPDLPEHDRLALWRLVYAALTHAEARGHCIALHQYGAPDLWGPRAKGGADWLLHRLEHQVLPRLPFKRVKFAVTEYGIDGLLLDGLWRGPTEIGVGIRTSRSTAGGPAGWQVFTTAEDYARQLINVGTYCERFSDRVLGYAVFTLGHNPPWQTYDIRGRVAELIAAASPTAIQPPPTGGTGGTMSTRVFDQRGQERTLDWLRSTFGARVVPGPVGKRFVLAEVRVTEGPASCVVRVQEGDRPLASHAVAFSWPDAPHDLTVPEAAAFKTRYKTRAAVQWTDAQGYTGFGLGGGSYIQNIAEGGPHAVWVLHHEYYSDALDGIGMLGGTDHVGPLRLVFALADPTPAPQSLAEALRLAAELNDRLAVNPNAALCKAGRARNLWPTSDEFPVSFGGVNYVAQRFRDPRNDRVYVLYCVKDQWGTVYTLEY